MSLTTFFEPDIYLQRLGKQNYYYTAQPILILNATGENHLNQYLDGFLYYFHNDVGVSHLIWLITTNLAPISRKQLNLINQNTKKIKQDPNLKLVHVTKHFQPQVLNCINYTYGGNWNHQQDYQDALNYLNVKPQLHIHPKKLFQNHTQTFKHHNLLTNPFHKPVQPKQPLFINPQTPQQPQNEIAMRYPDGLVTIYGGDFQKHIKPFLTHLGNAILEQWQIPNFSKH